MGRASTGTNDMMDKRARMRKRKRDWNWDWVVNCMRVMIKG